MRDANTGAERHVGPFDGMSNRNQLDELLGDLGGIFRVVQRVQQRGEFVSAHPRNDVVGSHASLEHARHATEDLITGIVAQRIVDALEAIEIDIEDGHAFAVPVDPRQRRIQCLMKATSVEQASQRVGYRLGFQLHVETAHHGHIQGDDNHGALLTRQWR